MFSRYPSVWTGTIQLKTRYTNHVSLLLIIAAVMMHCSASSVHAEPVLSKENALCFIPGDWVGKYPSNNDRAHTKFFDLSCVRNKLKVILSPTDFKAVTKTLEVETPIQMMGTYLVITKCEAHNCPSHHMMVVIETRNNDYFVGLYRRERNASITKWYASNGDSYYLPDEIMRRFLRQHQPDP